LRQRAAALPLLAGALLVAGRVEPGADVPFAGPETAAPEPHPAASTHPATIAITRGVLITIMTAIDGVQLPSGADRLSVRTQADGPGNWGAGAGVGVQRRRAGLAHNAADGLGRVRESHRINPHNVPKSGYRQQQDPHPKADERTPRQGRQSR